MSDEESAMWEPETGLEELRKTRPEVAEFIDYREVAFDEALTTLEEFQRYDGSKDLWAQLIRERDELEKQLADQTEAAKRVCENQQRLAVENKRLRFMVENGLGPEDMERDWM